MTESVGRHLEVGTLSADGSRRWDGRFWVLVHADAPPDPFAPPVRQSTAIPVWTEPRTFGIGGVILAALVAIVVSTMPIPVPQASSLDSALREIAFVTELRSWLAFGLPVLILSVGRRGVDVQLLRAMIVGFILGTAFMAVVFTLVGAFSIPTNPRVPGIVAVFMVGLTAAVTVGPIFALFVIPLNFLWYRSLRSLRPQLGIFNRSRAAAGTGAGD